MLQIESSKVAFQVPSLQIQISKVAILQQQVANPKQPSFKSRAPWLQINYE
jgi:hypothetical protein